MSDRVLEALLKLSARDATGNVFGSVAAKVERAGRRISAIGDRLDNMGRAAVGFTAGYFSASTLADMTRRAVDAERTLNRLGITAGATDEQIAAARRALLRHGVDAGATLKDMAGEAADTLTAAGVAFSSSIQLAPELTRAAKATGAEIRDLSGVAVTGLQNLGIPVVQVTKYLDTLATSAKAGRFEMADMAREFPALAAEGSKLGYVGIDGAAAISAMATSVREVAGSSSAAATKLNAFFTSVTSTETVNNFKKMGVSVERVMKRAQKEGRAFGDVMIEVIDKLTKGGDPLLIGKLFGNDEAKAAISQIIKMKGPIADLRATARDATGTIAADFARLSKDTQGSLDRFNAAVDKSMIIIASNWLPQISSWASEVADLFDSMERRSGGLFGSGSVFGDALRGALSRELLTDREKEFLFGKEVAPTAESEQAERLRLEGAGGSRALGNFVARDMSGMDEAYAEIARQKAARVAERETTDRAMVMASRIGNAAPDAMLDYFDPGRMERIRQADSRAAAGNPDAREVVIPPAFWEAMARQAGKLDALINGSQDVVGAQTRDLFIPNSAVSNWFARQNDNRLQHPIATYGDPHLPAPRELQGKTVSFRDQMSGRQLGGALPDWALPNYAAPTRPALSPSAQKTDFSSFFAMHGDKIAAEVSGPVTADLKGQADVNVNVRFTGPIGPAGVSASSTGAIRANVGVSMPDVEQ